MKLGDPLTSGQHGNNCESLRTLLFPAIIDFPCQLGGPKDGVEYYVAFFKFILQ